jgi:hypothetical protein
MLALAESGYVDLPWPILHALGSKMKGLSLKTYLGGGLAPSRQTVGFLFIPPRCQSQPGKWSEHSSNGFDQLGHFHQKDINFFQFLSDAELGNEELILREWLDVCVTDSGLIVARQKVEKPPLLVAQMTEEWLNHYRKLA